MRKKIFATFLIIAIITLASTFSITYATVNEIRNFMSGAENTIEGAAGGAANMVRNGTNTISGAIDNTMNDNQINGRNSITGTMTMDNTATGNYTATRTAVNADNVTVLGISARIWTIIIIAVALIGIGTLVWSYMTQRDHNHSNYYDE